MTSTATKLRGRGPAFDFRQSQLLFLHSFQVLTTITSIPNEHREFVPGYSSRTAKTGSQVKTE